jgi:hypothetical protein
MLGYAMSSFTTDQPLAAASSYLLTGPRLAVGLQLPVFDARVVLPKIRKKRACAPWH